MDITITPHLLQGEIHAIPSKSQAHRLLICSAFSDSKTFLQCTETNQDIEATVSCLCALGAKIHRTKTGYKVIPSQSLPASAEFDCRESGSTLRFMLPVVGALGVDTIFHMAGRLPFRPLSPLWEELERMGCTLTRPTDDTIRCQGKLTPGKYSIDGSVSSQYITGLLLALSLLPQESSLEITGAIQSKPYIQLTKEALLLFGTEPDHPGKHPLRSPGQIIVEGDWSNAAFFLAANAVGSNILLRNLNPHSAQGDRAVETLLPLLSSTCPTISAADVPDLIPVLSIVAAAKNGAVFTDIQRLRLKESDRVASILSMIESLGGKAEATKSTLTVLGTGLSGGTVDSVNDHRIAMSAAIAATVCQNSVTILNAQCVQKSYPHFWKDYAQLGGIYEQCIR